MTAPNAAALDTALEAAAVLISAVSGMITAAQKRMDIVGSVAFVYSRAFHERVRRWHAQAVLVDAMGLALLAF